MSNPQKQVSNRRLPPLPRGTSLSVIGSKAALFKTDLEKTSNDSDALAHITPLHDTQLQLNTTLPGPYRPLVRRSRSSSGGSKTQSPPFIQDELTIAERAPDAVAFLKGK